MENVYRNQMISSQDNNNEKKGQHIYKNTVNMVVMTTA